ncbi:hypothetical protein GCM10020000_86650 [Streptomyces olivoverticillatus]
MRHLEVPTTSDELCTALCELMAERCGRDCELRMTAFPPGSVSGLWVELDEQDLILVEENTAVDHKLVILGHEIWHMAAGHRALHVEGTAVAARLLADDAEPGPVIRQAAARSRDHSATDVCRKEEAESFGLLLASRVRPWLLRRPREMAVTEAARRGSGRRGCVPSAGECGAGEAWADAEHEGLAAVAGPVVVGLAEDVQDGYAAHVAVVAQAVPGMGEEPGCAAEPLGRQVQDLRAAGVCDNDFGSPVGVGRAQPGPQRVDEVVHATGGLCGWR